MSNEPTEREISAANLVTELENLQARLAKENGRLRGGLDGHLPILLGACILLAKDVAGIEHMYSTYKFDVFSNRHLRAENRELRAQVEALKVTARTLCGLAGLADPTLGSDANPVPVLKEHERREQ